MKISGGDQRLRTSILIRDRPDRGEEQKILQGESDGLSLQTHIKMTQHWMMRKLKMISGLLREISFVAITWNPESNCAPKKESFPIPLKKIDVARNTHTSLDAMFVCLERRFAPARCASLTFRGDQRDAENCALSLYCAVNPATIPTFAFLSEDISLTPSTEDVSLLLEREWRS